MANNIPKVDLPITFNRVNPVPLDFGSVVQTTSQLISLTADAARYLGQTVFNVEDSTLYVLTTTAEITADHFIKVGSNVSNTQAGTDISSLRAELTALSSELYSDNDNSLKNQLLSSLSSLDSIGELASALSALSSTVSDNNTTAGTTYLTKANPTIESGALTLAPSGSIVALSSVGGFDATTTIFTSAGQFVSKGFYVDSVGEQSIRLTSQGLYITQSYQITQAGAATFNSLNVGQNGSEFTVNNEGKITACAGIDINSSIKTTNSVEGSAIIASDNLSVGSGKFVVDKDGNVTVGKLTDLTQRSHLTVTGNLSVLGDVTYLETKVETLSTTLVSLSSDSETGLKVTQTGAHDVVTFVNGDGKGLNIDKDGKLSASTDAKFLSAVDITGKLTVTEDISSTNSVWGSAGRFADLLEVGPNITSVLYVNASGVGIDTETLSGYSLAIDSTGANKGTLYVAGSATLHSNIAVDGPAVFNSTVSVLTSTSVVELTGTGSTKGINLTGTNEVVTWGSMWKYLSALDGGTF